MIDMEKYRDRCEEDVEERWQASQDDGDACARGDCRYACKACTPKISEDGHVGPSGLGGLAEGQPYRVHDHACIGYQGTKHVEHGRPLMRYGLCRRQREWWAMARLKIRERKARETEAKKQAAKAWKA